MLEHPQNVDLNHGGKRRVDAAARAVVIVASCAGARLEAVTNEK